MESKTDTDNIRKGQTGTNVPMPCSSLDPGVLGLSDLSKALGEGRTAERLRLVICEGERFRARIMELLQKVCNWRLKTGELTVASYFLTDRSPMSIIDRTNKVVVT